MAPKKKAPEATYTVETRFGRTKSNLKMGIVGLPNVGKSSFFNLITARRDNKAVAAANVPFCTIDPNEGCVKIVDPRFDNLVDLWKPKSEVCAVLNIVDIAGLVRGAHEGEGLGNDFLSHISSVDGIFHMVRCFEDDDPNKVNDPVMVTHVDDSVDPARDLQTITDELCMKDSKYAENTIESAETKYKRDKKDPPKGWTDTMTRVKDLLKSNKLLSKQTWTPVEVDHINNLLPALLTTKPVIYLLNMRGKSFREKKGAKLLTQAYNWIKDNGGGTMIPFSVEHEQDLMDATVDEDEEEIKRLMEKGDHCKSVLPKIAKTGQEELNLLYFFTCGEDEVKCWTVYKGANAPQCAGAIHTDFERCFIKAEVCQYQDFIDNQVAGQKPSTAGVRALGKLKQEGKTYIVRDGEIIHFMHNAKK